MQLANWKSIVVKLLPHGESNDENITIFVHSMNWGQLYKKS